MQSVSAVAKTGLDKYIKARGDGLHVLLAEKFAQYVGGSEVLRPPAHSLCSCPHTSCPFICSSFRQVFRRFSNARQHATTGQGEVGQVGERKEERRRGEEKEGEMTRAFTALPAVATYFIASVCSQIHSSKVRETFQIGL